MDHDRYVASVCDHLVVKVSILVEKRDQCIWIVLYFINTSQKPSPTAGMIFSFSYSLEKVFSLDRTLSLQVKMQDKTYHMQKFIL